MNRVPKFPKPAWQYPAKEQPGPLGTTWRLLTTLSSGHRVYHRCDEPYISQLPHGESASLCFEDDSESSGFTNIRMDYTRSMSIGQYCFIPVTDAAEPHAPGKVVGVHARDVAWIATNWHQGRGVLIGENYYKFTNSGKAGKDC